MCLYAYVYVCLCKERHYLHTKNVIATFIILLNLSTSAPKDTTVIDEISIKNFFLN